MYNTGEIIVQVWGRSTNIVCLVSYLEYIKKGIRVDDCSISTDESMSISIDSTLPVVTDGNSFPTIDT